LDNPFAHHYLGLKIIDISDLGLTKFSAHPISTPIAFGS